jgi:hypothetical protein
MVPRETHGPNNIQIAQAGRTPEPDRDKTDLGLSPGLWSLISPSPPHSRDTRRCHYVHLYGRGTTARRNPSDAPLSSELWHCTPYPEFRPEATWAQPLGPGRAVLTRGVSRRSGSVACVRADASPTEVLAVSSLHRNPPFVKRSPVFCLVWVTGIRAGWHGLVTKISSQHTHP